MGFTTFKKKRPLPHDGKDRGQTEKAENAEDDVSGYLALILRRIIRRTAEEKAEALRQRKKLIEEYSIVSL